MIINPRRTDAYIAAKGLTPRLSDAEWHALFALIARLFGRDLRHRTRLVTQQHDELRRYSTIFPDTVPQPYRHIFHIEILLYPSPEADAVKEWLDAHGVEWQDVTQLDPEANQETTVGIKIFGFAAKSVGREDAAV